MSTKTNTKTPPFHRLLSFYSNRSSYPDTQTVRLQDSIAGNLALGLDFPVALAVAIGRHLYLRNTSSFFSLNIHVPSVPIRETPLAGVPVDSYDSDPDPAKPRYTCSAFVRLVRDAGAGIGPQIEAAGLWALAADVPSGLLSADDVRAFQAGTLFERIERRRRSGREQVLPLWRGGPISVAGHSWVVGKLWGVRVYVDEKDGKGD